ncbi:ribose 5-phosphate isomerase B [Rubrobacter marinus]|uniref:Ribose 5-phosphate isomerase B n=1 Tax=Rubrobacter marinus TaxID=2653852 RepID=A0A6G8PSV9_9ACTN|nr:ribose 5-phosphate isomerase B [Rubrobacter marinus]QIN77413.1 ribose 5-phosphate isomerase B [Rubrobacter marinus]
MTAIGIGADDAALELKGVLIEHLKEKGYEVQDYGIKEGADYPDVAVEVAEAVARGEHERAILCCGTGLGMSITANKVPGVRAAQCHDVYSAERARKSNNAQVLTMGQRVIGPEAAKTVLDAWLESEFAGGSSAKKVEKMEAIDRRYHGAASSS